MSLGEGILSYFYLCAPNALAHTTLHILRSSAAWLMLWFGVYGWISLLCSEPNLSSTTDGRDFTRSIIVSLLLLASIYDWRLITYYMMNSTYMR